MAKTIRFRKPSVLATATDAERDAMQFLRIRPICVEGLPDAHSVWLVVGDRKHRFSYVGDTALDASKACWGIALSLAKMRRGPDRRKQTGD